MIESFSIKKSLGPYSFTVEFCQTSFKELMPILLKPFYGIESGSLSKIIIWGQHNLDSKIRQDTKQKGVASDERRETQKGRKQTVYRSTSLENTDAKILSKILTIQFNSTSKSNSAWLSWFQSRTVQHIQINITKDKNPMR